MTARAARAVARQEPGASDAVDVTGLLPAVHAGDPEALARVMSAMYDALHRLAREQLAAEYGERTLGPTELVNEGFLRLFGAGRLPELADRRHLLGVAVRAMRQVLVDAARRRNAGKRVPAELCVPLDEAAVAEESSAAPGTVSAALAELEAIAPRQAQVVVLRVFAGLGERATAALLGVSERTVQRDWRMARAWLRRELEG
jgi:RNA polymerase sigma factor (TIGR02999 family)